MGGREEVDILFEEKTRKMLDNAPKILERYSYSFTKKSSRTKYEYINIAKKFIDFLNKESHIDVSDPDGFKDVRVSDVSMFISSNNGKRKNSDALMALRLSAIRDFFAFLEKDKYVSENPCDKIEHPKVDKNEVIAMTPDEIIQLKNNIIYSKDTPKNRIWKKRDLAIVTLGCSTGLRVSSICEINMEDIDFKKRVIEVVAKGKKRRECYIGEKTADILKEWIEERKKMIGESECDALFISNRKKRISPDAVQFMVKKYTADFDKHITPHKMRSSCATNLYEQTGDIYLVQDILGHENIENTKRYTKKSLVKRKKAVNTLDSLF